MNESPEERAARQFEELLQELRVMLPGVEILFAFLLTAPFSNRFNELPDYSRVLYIVPLVASALAIAMFISPTALHRLQGRGRDKRELTRISTRLAVTGMFFLIVAITTGIFIIVDFVQGKDTALALSATLAVVLVTLWFVLPLHRRRKLDGREP